MSATLDLHTNRDHYVFVTSLSPPEAARSLEDYLKALWCLGAAQRELPALPLPAFAGMLEAALRLVTPGGPGPAGSPRPAAPRPAHSSPPPRRRSGGR